MVDEVGSARSSQKLVKAARMHNLCNEHRIYDNCLLLQFLAILLMFFITFKHIPKDLKRGISDVCFNL